jgi:ribosomal protein L11 methyltransferase
VTASADAEEAVIDLLERIFHLPPSTYSPQEMPVSVVSVFCPATQAVTPAQLALLRAGLKRMVTCGLGAVPGRISVRKIRQEDWAESWKRHFKPIEIGRALLVKPGWRRQHPRPGQEVVILDPGLSFGTGNHPTTAFCLSQVVACRKTGQSRSFLDMGTGSGILAIAAAKLGYHPIAAFDYDCTAIRVARANARQNGVQKMVQFRRLDLTQATVASFSAYELVCANLETPLLIEQAPRIRRCLKPGGTLVLAGILATQFEAVERAYAGLGLECIIARTENEWRSGAFCQRCRR